MPSDGKVLKDHFLYVDVHCGFFETEKTRSLIFCSEIEENENFEIRCSSTKVVVNNDNTTIADDNTKVEDLDLSGNEQLEYLPIHTFLKFPLLINYTASHCAVRNISRKNFERLHLLLFLDLGFNSIETISGDTFKDLTKLFALNLGIKQVILLIYKYNNVYIVIKTSDCISIAENVSFVLDV